MTDLRIGHLKLSQAYKLQGRTKFQGLDISIENRKGSVRRWKDPYGKETGATKMHFDYGYIRRTEGTDGDHVDVYLGPNPGATHAYVIDQNKKPPVQHFHRVKGGTPSSAAGPERSHTHTFPGGGETGPALGPAGLEHVHDYGGIEKTGPGIAVKDDGKPWTKFDEQKVMLGFDSAEEAKAAYMKQYDDPRFFRSMKAVPMAEFTEKVLMKANYGKKVASGYVRDRLREAEPEISLFTELKLAGENLESLPEFTRHADYGRDSETMGDRERRKAKTAQAAAAAMAAPGTQMHQRPTGAPAMPGAGATMQAQRAQQHQMRTGTGTPTVVKVGHMKISKLTERQENIVERLDDAGLAVLAAPYAADAVAKLKTRPGRVGAVGRGAQAAANWMHKHETPMELGGLAVLAPGLAAPAAKALDTASKKVKSTFEKKSGLEKLSEAQLEALDKLAHEVVPDYEYMTEMEKQAIIGFLARGAGLLARGAKAVPGLARGAGQAIKGFGRGAAQRGRGALQTARQAVSSRAAAAGQKIRGVGQNIATKAETSYLQGRHGLSPRAAGVVQAERASIRTADRAAAQARAAAQKANPAVNPAANRQLDQAAAGLKGPTGAAPTPAASQAAGGGPYRQAAPTKAAPATPPPTQAATPPATPAAGAAGAEAPKKLLSAKNIALGTLAAGGLGTMYAGKKVVDTGAAMLDPRYAQHQQWVLPGVQGQGRVF